MAKKKKKIPIDGSGQSLPDDRFDSLKNMLAEDSSNIDCKSTIDNKVKIDSKSNVSYQSKVNHDSKSLWTLTKTRKGNFDIRVEKRGGGKTVTVIRRISGDMKALLKHLRKKCASGGAIKDNTIEIQGDHLTKINTLLNDN